VSKGVVEEGAMHGKKMTWSDTCRAEPNRDKKRGGGGVRVSMKRGVLVIGDSVTGKFSAVARWVSRLLTSETTNG